MPNTYFASQVTLSPKKARWLDFLSRFNFEWAYRPGRLNVADPLSRAKHLPELSIGDPNLLPAFAVVPMFALHVHSDETWDTGYAHDPWFADSRNTVRLPQKEGRWVTANKQIVVPNYGDFRRLIIQECHDVPYSGHPGVHRTVKNITSKYWWPHLFQEVQDYVKSCPSCQTSKSRSAKSSGLLRSVQAPKSRWQIVSMDFVTALPITSRGYSAILVVVDELTKMVRIIPCTENVGAKETAELFLRYVFKDHGMPLQFITDRGTQFTGTFMKELCRLLGTTQCLSTADHPQSDGQTERMNRVIEEVLRHYVNADETNWDLYLPLCEFSINNSWNESTKSTPFYLNYGRHPRVPIMPKNVDAEQDLYADALTPNHSNAELDPDLTLCSIVGVRLQQDMQSQDSLLQSATLCLAKSVPAAEEFARKLQLRIQMAKKALQAARSRMKAFANRSREDVSYSPGDLVLLNSKRLTFPDRDASKLKPKWIGPFAVQKRVGPVACKLKLPDTMKIHPVFHVHLLRRWYSDPSRPIHPDPIIIQGNEEFEVEAILDHRPKTATGPQYHGLQYLVKWKNYGPEHNQFQDRADMTHCRTLIREYWIRVKNPNVKGSGPAAPYHRKRGRPGSSRGVQRPKRGRKHSR